MTLTTVTVSNKGQIAIPVSIREEMGIEEGDTLVLFQADDRILIEKEKYVEKAMKDDMKDILKLNEASLKKIWDNKEDEIWNRYLKKK
ncbi:MAG: AbrB/MazE/SpoVT family DNA-binding domain-containing protein [Candidatus Nanoarchaeia archaeon]|nr:AbrB/MazE/SpoVT family DNA-binding domain-containing protein [Candidatus Nanoarchaeia archaeon]